MNKFSFAISVAVLCLTSPVWGANNVDRVLGKLVAVERTIHFDLEECAKNWKSLPAETGTYSAVGRAECHVRVLPNDPSSFNPWGMSQVESIDIKGKNDIALQLLVWPESYAVVARSYKASDDLSFQTVREAVKTLFNRSPNGEKKIIVYRVQ